MSQHISKTIEIEERKFIVKKYTAFEGLKIAKVLSAKILPVFQSFMPLVNEARKSGANTKTVFDNLGDYISLDSIAETLDKISPSDFDYILKKSLQTVSEVLPGGDAQVMNDNGTYGILDVEHDYLLVLRLVCEAVMWGVGDFFDGKRLVSIMSPLSSSLRRSPKI